MAYIGSSPTKVVSRQSANIFTYTATANQTAFTGADANGNTLACTPSDIMVHMNGLKLEESDYTATTTTVTLGSGAAAGDEVTITAFVTFESADAYTKSASDARYVNVTGDTMTGALTGTSAGFTGDVNIGNNASSNPLSKLRLGGTQYGAADIRPTDEGGHKVGMAFYTDGTGDTTIDPVLRMTIDSSGYVTKPNQPSFSAYRDAGHVTSGNVFVFDHTHFNRGNMYDTSNGRGTAPVAGKYLVTCWFMTRNDATYDNKYIRLRINGANPAHKNIYSSSGGAVHHQFSWSGVILLGANDYVDFYVDNLSVYGDDSKYSSFCMHLLD